jgi:predicted pyridoxine 5'-phosphate oxidase superfamily flavin-nucleotide-binding protein
MVSIPKHVQDFLPGKLAWVATASRDGEPNTTPKGTLKLLDENHVLFADLFSLKTRKNLLENKKVAVTVVDAATGKGYQIKGTAEVLSSGPLFEATTKQLKESPKKLPPVQHVVKITVEAVFDQSVGADAGKQIA